ncbi:MAG: cytochrome-c peroxidase [Acidobacteriota bacterium]
MKIGKLVFLFLCIIALGGLACAPVEPVFEPEIAEIPPLPLGLDAGLLKVPEDNPMTAEKVALGWQLFYDPRLSSDESVSCASCHLPEAGFADPRPGSVGVGGGVGSRNAPPVINAAFNANQFWDGRAASLEEQVFGPVQNPIEMANTLEACEDRLNEIPGYGEQFEAVFGSERITAEMVGKAIASFERVVLSGNSPWDRWVETHDESVVSDAVRRGNELFRGKAGCSQCHLGTNFTDAPFDLYHNIGVGMDDPEPDLGRYNETQRQEDRGAFKTPTLRNVADTAPYMHDGSVATLEEVIEFYDRGGEPNLWLDPKMKPLELTEQEKQDLLAFLLALTGEVPEWTRRAPRLPADIRGS